MTTRVSQARVWLAAAALWLACGAASRAADSACVAVEGDEIRAGDVAKIWEAFRGLPQDQPVAPAPAPPLRRLFTGPELGNLARKLKLNLKGAAIPPSKGCFERRMTPLVRARLMETLVAAVEKDGFEPGSIQLELIDHAREPVPVGDLDFQPQGLSRPPAGAPATPVIWRGRVRFGAGRSYPVWARVRLLARQPRLVAATAIAAGKAIKPGEVEIAMLEVFPYPRIVEAPSPGLAHGRMSRRTIRAGELVAHSMLGVARDVERGDVVTVEVNSGAAKLRFDAKAESGGRKGDMIMVRNPSNGRRFQGRVGEQGTVTVDVAATLSEANTEKETHAEKP